MPFKNIQSLNDVKQFMSSLEKMECGIRTPFFSTENYSHLRVNNRIIEFPEFPIDEVFNRIVISKPNSTEYLSVTLEPQTKISSQNFKKRKKIRDNWYPMKDAFSETDFYFNDKLNYESLFFSFDDPIQFLSTWIHTIFSEETIRQFLDGKELSVLLSDYKTKFKENEKEVWKNSYNVLRIVEERNDIRIILLIHPYDLHPELTICSLENIGIVTPLTSLFFSWFDMANLIRLGRKVGYDFHETVQFKKYPEVLNNEQIFEINTTPINIDGLDMVDVVIKGAKNQVKFYKDYFLKLLDIYPLDFSNKAEFEGEEIFLDELFGKKLKYYHGTRVYIKPEFDLMILFYPELVKDDNQMEYLEFHFIMRYRPFIKNRERDTKWTWHHLLEDLGK